MTLKEISKLIKINKSLCTKSGITDEEFFGRPMQPIIEAEKRLINKDENNIAYLSMEFGLATTIYNTFWSQTKIGKENFISHHEVFSNMRAMDYYHVLPFEKLIDLPIYSGGLGVLAGDCLKSAADLKISFLGVGILWNKGYFNQKLWYKYGQIDEEIHWDPSSYPGLIKTDEDIKINYGSEEIYLNLWKYPVYSHDKKHVVILLLLDSNTEKNSPKNRMITDQLYRSDDVSWKIGQRLVLGVGAMKAITKLGYSINKYHLNEGHAAFAFIEKTYDKDKAAIKKLAEQFVYTCHTPVEAGHDRFSVDDISKVLDKKRLAIAKSFGHDPHNANVVNLTQLAMNACSRVNAVAEKHGEVTRLQFPKHKEKIKTVTNGIHTYTWVSDSFSLLFDKYQKEIGDWHKDPKNLKNVLKLKENKDFRKDIWLAHVENKENLANFFKSWLFSKDTFTICWARRLAQYKRPNLIFHNIEKLIEIARINGPIQIVIAGKAHPNDDRAAYYIDDIMKKIDSLGEQRGILKIALLENYNTYIGKFLTSNVDVWLNNPLPPFEASGTSGMKAILNGVVQLSTLDGWVVEAEDKGIGNIFGYKPAPGVIGDENHLRFDEDSNALYSSLSNLVTLYYQAESEERHGGQSKWVDMMINCVSESAFFSSHRMVEDYKKKIWE